MFFPEFLYQLSGRDQQVTWLDPSLQSSSDAAAALTVAEIIQVPTGKVLLLQHVMNESSPGAGQNITNMLIDLLPPAGTFTVRLKSDDTDRAANTFFSLDWQGSIIVPPEWFIRAQSNFNAAVAVNTVALQVAGAIIPVGNIQRV